MTSNATRRLLMLSVVLGILGLGSVGTSALAAYRTRNAPTTEAIVELLHGNWPNDIVGRWILLKPGSPMYAATVAPLLVAEENGLTDTPWNRYLVERFLVKSGPFVDIDTYPFVPGDALVDALAPAAKQGNQRLLSIIAKSSRGRTLVTEWIDERVKGGTAATFFDAFPFAFALGADSVLELSKRLKASPEQFGTAIGSLRRYSLGPEGWLTLRLTIERAVSLNGLNPDRFRNALVELMLRPDSANVIASLLLQSQKGGRVLRVLACDANEFQDRDCAYLGSVDEQLRTQLLGSAFSKVQKNSTMAADVFHTIAHSDSALASQLVVKACAQEDSTLRKSLVVLAVRHGVNVGCLDSAFSGPAPRKTNFRSLEEYSGSIAGREYERISGHPYAGVGKRWPPVYGRDPVEADTEAWEGFISRFPWFPATDDAYYRLAYSHLLNGDSRGALAVVSRYRSANLPDQDSTPFINVVETVALAELGNAVTADRVLEVRGSATQAAWSRNPPSRMLDLAAERIDWSLRHWSDIGTTDTVQQLRAARIAVDASRTECVLTFGTRCQIPPSVESLLGYLVPPRSSALWDALLR